MSDYHIRDIATDWKTINLVFHVPIPTGNNTVGVAWRTALVAYLGGADAITSVMPDIPAADLTAMKAGELFENAATYRFTSINLTDLQRLNEVEAEYTRVKTSYINTLQVALKYYGKSGDVA